jgi:hypothetical protein
MIDINKEAEEYANNWEEITGLDPENTSPLECSKIDFIAGHNSKGAQAKVLQGQIDLLISLDSKLQSKIEFLKNMTSEKEDDSEYFTLKISGVRLTKEEIRRDLKELQQQLKELENE